MFEVLMLLCAYLLMGLLFALAGDRKSNYGFCLEFAAKVVLLWPWCVVADNCWRWLRKINRRWRCDMGEIAQEVKTFKVHCLCDSCGDGEMLPTGISLCTCPPSYPHECSKCGESVTFKGKIYPVYVTRSVAGGEM